MKLSLNAPRLMFFLGKGGVGKTTIAASAALYIAARLKQKPAILVSTDPAHSLGDLFQVQLGSEPRRLRGTTLELWQIDAKSEFRRFTDDNREAMLQVLSQGTMFSREELEPLLDSTLPGLAQVAGLLAIQRLIEDDRFAHIIVDTAPFGHTIRLLGMPRQFRSFLQFIDVAADRDRALAAAFGGSARTASNPFVERWNTAIAALQRYLSGEDSHMVLVTTPEKFSLHEAERVTDQWTQDETLRIDEVVLNRAVRDAGSCKVCAQGQKRTNVAENFLRKTFPGVPIRMAELSGAPIVGKDALARFAEHVWNGRSAPRGESPKSKRSSVKLVQAEWPCLNTPLTLTLGKGGVGKTTISAALAFHTRERSRSRVIVCSTDPAPSLDDVFRQNVGDAPRPVLDDKLLLALEIDAEKRFRAWADEVKEKIEEVFSAGTQSVHVDLSFERQLFLGLLDIVPPGLDELAAVFEILDLLKSGAGHVVIDMAPTGHALELLQTPDRIAQWMRLLLKALAPHRGIALARDIAYQLAKVSTRARELHAVLADAKQSTIVSVMTPEPLPDRETQSSLRMLRSMRLPTGPLIVNRVLVSRGTTCRRCRLAAEWQKATLSGLGRQYGGHEILAVPERGDEIIGAAGLRSFTKRIWQIA